MRRWILVILIGLALVVVVVIVGVTQIKQDALQEPGHVETFLATLVKHLLVRRSSLWFTEQLEESTPLLGEDPKVHRDPKRLLVFAGLRPSLSQKHIQQTCNH